MRKLAVLLMAFGFCGFTQKAPDLTLPDSVYLQCVPPLDRSDADPITGASVSAEFDKKNGSSVTTFNVIHRSYYGRTFNRTDQYDATLESQRDSWRWSWNGYLKKNPRHHMIGTLSYNGNWTYSETLVANGRAYASTTFKCSVPEYD